jgi:hypothetical protein
MTLCEASQSLHNKAIPRSLAMDKQAQHGDGLEREREMRDVRECAIKSMKERCAFLSNELVALVVYH